MRVYLSKLFSASNEASFGRVATAVLLVPTLVWISYIVFKTTALPELHGLPYLFAALYGSSKLGDIVGKFGGGL